MSEYCFKCGAELKDGADFCSKCGTGKANIQNSNKKKETGKNLLKIGILCFLLFILIYITPFTSENMPMFFLILSGIICLIAGFIMYSSN